MIFLTKMMMTASSSDYAALYSHCDDHDDDNAIKTLAKTMIMTVL